MLHENGRSIDYWANRWITGEIGWHISGPNEHLVNNCHLLLPSNKKHRVLVPLCGKSEDLIWLYKQGHQVVGIEAVENIVKEYFEEHSLAFNVLELSFGKLYQTIDQDLQIYICDLYKMPTEQIEKVDAVWDRASLVAINEKDRLRYSAVIKELLHPVFRYLLHTVHFIPNEKHCGPPCNVPLSLVEELYGDISNVQLLYSSDVSYKYTYVDAGIPEAEEPVILLSNKK